MPTSKQAIVLLTLAASSVLATPVAKPQMVFAPNYCKVKYTVEKEEPKMDVAGIVGDYSIPGKYGAGEGEGGGEFTEGSNYAVETTVTVGINIGLSDVVEAGVGASVAITEQKGTSQAATVPCPKGEWQCGMLVFPDIMVVSGQKEAAEGSENYCTEASGLGPYTVELPILGKDGGPQAAVDICACKNFPHWEDEGAPELKCDECPSAGAARRFHFPADDGLKANISAAFTDTVELIRTVIDTAGWNTPIFDLYFPPEHRSGIAITFRNMLAGVHTELAFDNYFRADIQDPERRDVCISKGWVAFTINGPIDRENPQPSIHCCPATFTFTTLSDVVNNHICAIPQMALNMRFQGSILLHEVSHITDFHPGRRVRDIKYGPSSVQTLRKEQPCEAINNADNYMWFALQVYWTYRCGKNFAPPTTDDWINIG
ncbi:MAG: hypothetical protein Q9226_004561 [Calogaya cf. arnoldii]